MINIISSRANSQQIAEMLQSLETYIKLAVDVRQGILAGGGEMHADCEAVLLEAGSQQEDIWGADWNPASQMVTFESLINIRPRQNNRSLEIQDPSLSRFNFLGVSTLSGCAVCAQPVEGHDAGLKSACLAQPASFDQRGGKAAARSGC